MFQMLFSEYRAGQLGAHKTILSLVLDKIVSIVLPTRYGKSDVIRCSFLDMYYQGLVSCAVVLSPARNLQRQMVKDTNLNKMFARYKIQMPDVLLPFRPTASGAEAYTQWRNLVTSSIRNNPVLISTTHQFAVLHGLDSGAWLSPWVKHVIHMTGKPPIFYVDECHLGSFVNKIGALAQELRDAGAYVVVLTATPYRADGEKIPGFDYKPIDYDVIEQTIFKKTGDPSILLMQLREVLKGTYRMKADYEYTFADAWEENPSPLCDIDLVPVDVNVQKHLNGVESGAKKMLSALSSSEAQRILGRHIIREYDYQVKIVKVAIRELERLRVYARDVAMIIFVGTDTEDEDNHEAKAVQKILKAFAPSLSVVIATSTTENATDTIDAFVDGKGDVLIVKMMAGLGLDCPRLKVGVDLSPIRTIASFAQRLMRIATLFDRCGQAVWIAPSDAVGVELFHMIVTSSGGTLTRTEASRVLEEEEVEREIDKKIEQWVLENPHLGDVQNNRQHVGRREYWPPLETFVQRAPGVLNHMSRATLMDALASAFPDSPASSGLHEDLNEKIKELKNSIQHWRCQWVDNALKQKRGHGYNGAGGDEQYEKEHKECWTQMRFMFGLPKTWSITAETDINLLESVRDYFKEKATFAHE